MIKDEYEIDGHYFHIKINEWDEEYLDYEIKKYFEPDSETPSNKKAPIEIIDELEQQIWDALHNLNDEE